MEPIRRGQVLGFGVDVDFGDAYLAATAAEHSDKIATFDDDFGAFSDVVADHPR